MSINSKFELGQIVETRGIAAARESNKRFDREVNRAFARYIAADFSDMQYAEDIAMNYDAIQNGNARIFATYNTCKGKIYIITEWDRSCTTILFPSEY